MARQRRTPWCLYPKSQVLRTRLFCLSARLYACTHSVTWRLPQPRGAHILQDLAPEHKRLQYVGVLPCVPCASATSSIRRVTQRAQSRSSKQKPLVSLWFDNVESSLNIFELNRSRDCFGFSRNFPAFLRGGGLRNDMMRKS